MESWIRSSVSWISIKFWWGFKPSLPYQLPPKLLCYILLVFKHFGLNMVIIRRPQNGSTFNSSVVSCRLNRIDAKSIVFIIGNLNCWVQNQFLRYISYACNFFFCFCTDYAKFYWTVCALALTYVMGQRYLETSKIMPAGVVAGLR